MQVNVDFLTYEHSYCSLILDFGFQRLNALNIKESTKKFELTHKYLRVSSKQIERTPCSTYCKKNNFEM